MSLRVMVSKLLDRLGGNPWALSCLGFVTTAVLIRSNSFF